MKVKIKIVLFILLFLISKSLSALTYDASLKLGLPHPLNLGTAVEINSNWIVGVHGNFWSPTISVSEVSVHANNINLYAQYFPWGETFFLGFFLGKHSVFAEKSKDVDVILLGNSNKVPVTAEGTIRSWYLGPNVGWRFTWEQGLFLSLDLGILIPFAASTTLDARTSDPLGAVFLESVKQTDSYKKLESEVADQGNKLGRTVLPTLTLIEIGWRF